MGYVNSMLVEEEDLKETASVVTRISVIEHKFSVWEARKKYKIHRLTRAKRDVTKFSLGIVEKFKNPSPLLRKIHIW